jgi:hypothetical protein
MSRVDPCRGPSRLALLVLAGLSGVLVLGGCSKSDEPAGSAATRSASKAVVHASPDADLVAAVATGTGTSPAVLRFELQERPVLGQPFHVRLQVMPSQDVSKLRLTFDVSAGLEITDASPSLEIGKTPAGEAKEKILSLHGTAEGVFELRASVTVDDAPGATYSIPLIVTAEAAPPKP